MIVFITSENRYAYMWVVSSPFVYHRECSVTLFYFGRELQTLYIVVIFRMVRRQSKLSNMSRVKLELKKLKKSALSICLGENFNCSMFCDFFWISSYGYF